MIHYTAMKSAQAAITRLCDPDAEVSAHYVIARTGETTQLVCEEMRAWHAGAGEWHGADDINSRSIGIELDNAGDHPFPEAQMCSLERLLSGCIARWAIKPEGVIGHSDMAPGRKIDPGLHFDWGRLERQGLAAKQPPFTSGTDAKERLAEAGYTGKEAVETLKLAARLRWGARASLLA